MTSQELPSRESSTHGTYKPIGERFAYKGIAPYANLSPIGLYVSRDEDSLEVVPHEGPGPVSFFSPIYLQYPSQAVQTPLIVHIYSLAFI